MRTPTPECLLTLQPFLPVPIPYSHPLSGFGNLLTERQHPWDFPRRDGWGQRGLPGNVVPVNFILGEMPKLSTAAETGGFLTSRLLSRCPCSQLSTVGKAGRDCTSLSCTPNPPYMRERHQPPHHNHDPKLSGLELCDHCCHAHELPR